MNLRTKYVLMAAAGAAAAAGGGAPAAGADTSAGAGSGDTMAGGSGGDTMAGAGDGKVIWPENWRDSITTDEKEKAQLARYATPQDIWKKARALEQRISSGELKAAPPKDASPEVLAQWRADNGIPPDPLKYDIKLRQGLEVAAEDKPIFEAFQKRLHGKNVTNDQMSGLVEAYYEVLQEQTDKDAQTRQQASQKVEDALRGEWGDEYRGNVTRIENLLNLKLPANSPLKENLVSAMKGNADMAKFLDGLARDIMPVTTLLPGNEGGVASAVEDQIKEIETLMRKDRAAYNKDQALQDKYQELLRYRERAAAQKTG